MASRLKVIGQRSEKGSLARCKGRGPATASGGVAGFGLQSAEDLPCPLVGLRTLTENGWPSSPSLISRDLYVAVGSVREGCTEVALQIMAARR